MTHAENEAREKAVAAYAKLNPFQTSSDHADALKAAIDAYFSALLSDDALVEIKSRHATYNSFLEKTPTAALGLYRNQIAIHADRAVLLEREAGHVVKISELEAALRQARTQGWKPKGTSFSWN